MHPQKHDSSSIARGMDGLRGDDLKRSGMRSILHYGVLSCVVFYLPVVRQPVSPFYGTRFTAQIIAAFYGENDYSILR